MNLLEKSILLRFGDEILESLQEKSPGKIKERWTEGPVEDHQIVISNDTPYLPFLMQGTGVYGPFASRIYPKTASVLSWLDENGRRIFATSVKGMKSQPFVSEAIAEGMTKAGEV